MTENIDNLFAMTFYTYDRIREAWWIWKNWDEAFSLYIRYIKQARMQKTDKTRSLDSFMTEAMWWSEKKFKKVKKILVDLGLIEQIRGKWWDASIKVNYIIWKEKTEAIKNKNISEKENEKLEENSDNVEITPSEEDRVKNTLSWDFQDRVILDRVKITLQNIYKEVNKNKNISNKIYIPQNSFFYEISKKFLDFQISQNVHQILFLIKNTASKIKNSDFPFEKYSFEDLKDWELNKNEFQEELAKIIIINNWAEEAEKLKRIDKYTEEQIEFVFEFTKQDEFWKNQILSIKKFREKNKNNIPYFVVMIDKIKEKYKKPQFQTGVVVADNF